MSRQTYDEVEWGLEMMPPGPKPTLPEYLSHFTISDSGCWLWTRSTTVNGYPHAYRPNNGGHVYAHRGIFEVLGEPIPQHLELDHLCRVRHCVNPDHLELV